MRRLWLLLFSFLLAGAIACGMVACGDEEGSSDPVLSYSFDGIEEYYEVGDLSLCQESRYGNR